MTPFSITQSTRRYRIVGLKAQRPALPLSVWAAWREAGLFGLPAGALLAWPVALRTNGPVSLSFLVWLAATGLLGIAITVCTGLLRMGRPLPSAIQMVPIGILFAAGPLAYLGGVLHAHTHHRPLGAATFAVLSLGILLGCFALAARTRSTLSSSDAGQRLFGRVLLYGGTFASLLIGLNGFVAILSSAKAHPSYLGCILDGLLGIAMCLMGGFLRYSPRFERFAKRAGPLAMTICVLALLVALKDSRTSEALARCLSLWAALRPT
jgi:hypothetical protein